MKVINNFNQVHKILAGYIPAANQPGSYSLVRMQQLMSELGNPQDSYKAIHVAGTSGKTSTCYFIAAMIKASGQKVGLTVSPHVDEVNERLQINLQPMEESKFCKQLIEFINLVDQTAIHPTYFELLVAFAYWEFNNQKVDYAVVEVGLGGLLDGTNVINRPDKVCVITDIGLDHTNVLGNTLGEIATQKAGIIQPHNQVFVYQQNSEIMQKIKTRCAEAHASLHEVLSDTQPLNLTKAIPPFQIRNWYLAKNVFDFIAERDNLAEPGSNILLKTSLTVVPARMEIVNYKEQVVIIDGSHNGQKMSAITEGIAKLYSNQLTIALISFVQSEHQRSKDALEQLLKITDSLIITAFSGQQDTPKHSIRPEIIAQTAKSLGFKDIQIISDPKQAFLVLIKRKEPIKLVTGSFYLLNHIRPLLKSK